MEKTRWHLYEYDLSGPGGREEKKAWPVWTPLRVFGRCHVDTESRQKWDSERIPIWLKSGDRCMKWPEEEKEFLMSKPMGALLMLATSWWACISRSSNTAAAEKQSKVLVNGTAIWVCTQPNTHTCPDNWRLALSVSFTFTIQQPFYRRNTTTMNNWFEFKSARIEGNISHSQCPGKKQRRLYWLLVAADCAQWELNYLRTIYSSDMSLQSWTVVAT